MTRYFYSGHPVYLYKSSSFINKSIKQTKSKVLSSNPKTDFLTKVRRALKTRHKWLKHLIFLFVNESKWPLICLWMFSELVQWYPTPWNSHTGVYINKSVIKYSNSPLIFCLGSEQTKYQIVFLRSVFKAKYRDLITLDKLAWRGNRFYVLCLLSLKVKNFRSLVKFKKRFVIM